MAKMIVSFLPWRRWTAFLGPNAFEQGNKRTAFAAMRLFLDELGFGQLALQQLDHFVGPIELLRPFVVGRPP